MILFEFVAPEIPAFGVGLLAAFLAVAGLLMLRYVWFVTFHPIFYTLAHLFDVGIPIPFRRAARPFAPVGRFFSSIDNSVMRAIGHAIANREHAWHTLLSWYAFIVTKQADELANLSYDALQALHLVHAKVSPAAIRAATMPLVKATVPAVVVHVLPRPAAVKQAADHYPQLAARVTKLEREIAHATTATVTVPIAKPAAKEVAAAHAAVGAIAIPIPGLSRAERDASKARKWVDANAKRLSIAGIVGLIGATIFRHFKLGWLRCPGVGRVGRSLCGMSGLIESLFADALDVLLVTNLCQMTQLMERTARAFEPELAYIVSLTDGLAKCRGTKPARPLPVRRYDPPPVSASIAV